MVWVTEIFHGIYLLAEMMVRTSSLSLTTEDMKYVVGGESIVDSKDMMEADFIESEKEKKIREEVTRLNPYDFWAFVRSNIHDSKLDEDKADPGRSEYY